MYCLDFEYDGEKLSDYGMLICSFGGANDGVLSSGADISFQQVRPSGSNTFHLYSSVYNDTFTATFQICKNPHVLCSQDNLYLSAELLAALQRWLCRKEYHKFKILQEGYEHIYWNAVFESKQYVISGKTAGLELILHTDAPFAYMDSLTLNYSCKLADGNAAFDVYDLSDEIGFLRPDLTIKILSHTNTPAVFQLENSMDTQITKINNCVHGETITINGRQQTITTDSASHKLTLAKDFNYFFPKIINTYQNNRNTFGVNLDCEIQLSYSPIKKVGI